MNLTIVEYPDKRLKQKSKKVEVFDASLHTLLDGMYEVMISHNGIGLAAIQVGYALDVLILNIPNEEDEQNISGLIEMINPEIVKKEGVTHYQEGCLSVPGFYEDIERFEYLHVKYQNRHGEMQFLEAQGLLSIAIQHEMDHLLGVLFIDKLSYMRRKKFEKEYKRIQKEKKTAK